MLNPKRQTIELGGQGNASSHAFLQPNSGMYSPSSQSINFGARQAIMSPHKISNKVSPNKQKLPPQRVSRQNSGMQNSTHTFQMQNSKVSTLAKLSQRALFEERSNVMSPINKGISINYSTGVSPGQSRNSSIHQKETISPSKIIQSQPKTQYELELQRKLKIVEMRISELHRQKQQIAAKLNQENRKVYHQNVTLKHKISQMSKVLQKSHRMQNLTSERSQASSNDTFAFQNANMQVSNLKREIVELEQTLAEKGSIEGDLITKNQTLQADLTKVTSLCESLQQELRRLNELLTKKSHALEQSETKNKDILAQMQQYQQNKISQEIQMENIRQMAFQNEQRYKVILKEYQSKIEQYQNAYNSNQQLIKHLQQQVQNYQNVAQSVIKQETIQESAVHTQLANQCQELQDNLMTSIQERDAIIEDLNNQNTRIMCQLQNKQRELRESMKENDEKTQKLVSASQLLEKVTYKFQELSQRYQELSEKYQLQKNKLVKSGVLPQKCKKCEELLKTVLRLNSHLNLKKG